MNDKSVYPSWLANVDRRGGTCRSCEAAIYWGRTTNGKRVPVDQEPVDGKFVSHFATCPDRDQHRKPR